MFLEKTTVEPIKDKNCANCSRNAIKYSQQQANTLNFDQYDRITVVDHSLGGIIATCVAYVAYWASEDLGQTVYCHTFNAAPGAKYALMDSPDKYDPAIADCIINHCIPGNSVSGPPKPIGTDEEGYPYAHWGYIYNWRPLEADSLTSIVVHSLAQFITDLKCETCHLMGIGSAPISTYYW